MKKCYMQLSVLQERAVPWKSRACLSAPAVHRQGLLEEHPVGERHHQSAARGEDLRLRHSQTAMIAASTLADTKLGS